MTAEAPIVAHACPAGINALRRLVWEPGWRRVCVLGASKNAGKTTTLNALSAAARQLGHRIGLCSMGLDGEAYDAWLDQPKPRVQVEKGTLVVTAAVMAAQAGPLLRVLKSAGFGSALGESVLCEARGPGGVQLCGVPHREHLAAATLVLQQAGAQRVLIDGAYHRQAAAHADVADAVVLAIGAVLGPDPQAIALAAAPTLIALSTPLWRGPEAGTLQVAGALSDAWLARQSLADLHCLVVQDPSRVLLSLGALRQLAVRGIRIAALHAVPLCAITSSAYRPGGSAQDAASLQGALSDLMRQWSLAERTIVDVVTGLSIAAGEVPA